MQHPGPHTETTSRFKRRKARRFCLAILLSLAGDPATRNTHSHRSPLEPTLIVNTPNLMGGLNFAGNKLGENQQNPESFDIVQFADLKPG